MVNASYDASGSYIAIYDQTAYDESAGVDGVIAYNNGDMAWILVAAVSPCSFCPIVRISTLTCAGN
jgi:hypothetical protein